MSEYICTHCRHNIPGDITTSRSFMGFRKIHCPMCGSDFKHPLPQGYVVFYWVVIIAGIALPLFYSSRGGYFIPNPIGMIIYIAIVVAIYKNGQIKENIATLKASSLSPNPTQDTVQKLISQGCRVVKKSEGEWEILFPTGESRIIQSAESLAQTAASLENTIVGKS